MWKILLVSEILALLVYTISGLVPPKSVPHDHLLIGFVTEEELRAHEAAESLEMQGPAEAPAAASGAPGVVVTGTGGLIISVAPGLAGIISVLHVEIALQFAFLLFVPLAYRSISILKIYPQEISLASPDPPPRRFSIPV